MSLYDDLEPVKQKNEEVAGWSSGIKFFQSQLQLKKASQTQPKKEHQRKAAVTLAPVIDLKSKREEDDSYSYSSNRLASQEFDWNISNEYDPMWPNDYEKVVRDLKELKEIERDREELEKKRKPRDERGSRREREIMRSGFGARKSDNEEEEDEEEEERDKIVRTAGAAIAPPPSLQESKGDSPQGGSPGISFAGSTVAAKIMAKYGFKEGQGLGKKEQGMSLALQVEKTSKRGGRIIHEKDIFMPPPLRPDSPSLMLPPGLGLKNEPSITEIMKSPSKVVLLRNMVGPGEVDDDLEPEVKDECNTKYGDVVKVIIFEMPGAPNDEAIRIFVEFKRIESAIKAVVDLNGRFFGGRQVKAGFYLLEKFNSLELQY